MKADFYEIYDYIYVPFWKTRGFTIAIAAAFLILLAIGTYFFIRWRRKQKLLAQKLSPSEWALQELQKLTPETYETKQEFKTFYFTITTIIKKYLKKSLNMNVLEKTDDELIFYLKDHTNVPIEKVEKILNGSLLIKFANAQALREQAKQDLNITKTIIINIKDIKIDD